MARDKTPAEQIAEWQKHDHTKGLAEKAIKAVASGAVSTPRPKDFHVFNEPDYSEAYVKTGAHEKKPRRRRKQAGREETQVHRDVREMVCEVWPHRRIQEEYPFQLCEGHSYTVDFRVKGEDQDIRIEAKGAHCWEDSRVKFLWCMTQIRWAFFVWAKLRKNGVWYFEVWHAGARLKMKGKRQNPRSMAECAELIRGHNEGIDRAMEGG